MNDDQPPRTLELTVEVEGSPEEVWQAIATGPGISSWFVPHTVEEREGGATTSVFGPEPEMTIPGRVVAWDPPHRVLFDGGEGVEGLAFEWLVEARDGGTCVVRLVNSGFGSGQEWDAQYDGMKDGWRLFLHNLQLHMAHFRGQRARSILPSSTWAGDRPTVWATIVEALGLPSEPAVGDRVTAGADVPPLAGRVVAAEPGFRLTLLLDSPAPGTAFIATEGTGDITNVSVWLYLYGDRADGVVARDEPRWVAWLAERVVPTAEPPAAGP